MDSDLAEPVSEPQEVVETPVMESDQLGELNDDHEPTELDQ